MKAVDCAVTVHGIEHCSHTWNEVATEHFGTSVLGLHLVPYRQSSSKKDYNVKTRHLSKSLWRCCSCWDQISMLLRTCRMCRHWHWHDMKTPGRFYEYPSSVITLMFSGQVQLGPKCTVGITCLIWDMFWNKLGEGCWGEEHGDGRISVFSLRRMSWTQIAGHKHNVLCTVLYTPCGW